MNDQRQGAIAGLVLRLHETCAKLLNGSQSCSFEYSSVMYGALAHQMQSNALLWPEPAVPFPNLNYSILVQKVLSFKSPKWYSSSSSSSSSSYHDSGYQHSCLHSSFKSLLDGLDHKIEGLGLDSLVHG